MASTQRKDRREKELLELGRQARGITEERDRLKEKSAELEEKLGRMQEELHIANVSCEELRDRVTELRKEEEKRAAHYTNEVNARDARIHALSSDLQRRSQDLAEAHVKLAEMDGHDIKTLRRRLQEKSEEIRGLKTTISRLEAQRRKALV